MSLPWFHVAPIEPGITIVAEPGHVSSWLIAGRDRSILLDTGLGIGDIAAAVAGVAPSPVEVVCSHAHFDHIGGNAAFAAIAIHERGAASLRGGVGTDLLRRYGRIAADLWAAWPAFAGADREGFHVLGPDEAMRPWPPPGVDLDAWAIPPSEATTLLADGDRLDLGDRVLRVIHTPGHAPDHICLLDERAGILFAQDQAYYGPHLLYGAECSLADWERSQRRLASEVAPGLRVIYAAHCLRPAVPPRLLGELADAAGRTLAGDVATVPGAGLFGEPVRCADFGHFSLLLPPG
jgi:glyoxylase-like metal-dependent hydrolase (beta-lactamase superfamily II)